MTHGDHHMVDHIRSIDAFESLTLENSNVRKFLTLDREVQEETNVGIQSLDVKMSNSNQKSPGNPSN